MAYCLRKIADNLSGRRLEKHIWHLPAVEILYASVFSRALSFVHLAPEQKENFRTGALLFLRDSCTWELLVIQGHGLLSAREVPPDACGHFVLYELASCASLTKGTVGTFLLFWYSCRNRVSYANIRIVDRLIQQVSKPFKSFSHNAVNWHSFDYQIVTPLALLKLIEFLEEFIVFLAKAEFSENAR